MKLKSLLASVAVAALATTAQAAEVELSLSHWVGAQHPLQPGGMEPWVESIREASEGRIEITIFPAQQLGAAADHYDMARDGVVDIAFINPGYQPGRFPIIAAGEIPFTISNANAGSRAFDEWYREYAADEMKDVHFCITHLHDPGTLHGVNGPIQVPDDLKGKSIRPAHGTMARMLNHIGAASVFAGAAEMRELLARGAAEMSASPWGSIFTFGAQDLTKHHLDMPFYVTTFAFVFNKGVYEGLSPENRKVIDDHCNPESAEKMAAKWVENEAKGRQRMIDEGHTLYKPTDDEVQLWMEAASPLRNEWKETVNKAGGDADAIWQRLEDTLAKYDSRVK
ncbi:TRAP transporter substrate-binding protein [Aquamicrobium zhengzhouense]|uniref:TRAP transporter substrate-binding protein n=1 Tax=Aquamicrobium zhengzhouense TaxID=2781738 RepID=A0ABS0S9G0_9HYPH|nr:TRAP transporter substrate-binding protein [Aquamicrobium zhengzhouense]MBI1619882.1 TRAP transporter substrate-binding protein [Aquamicrobium zhengzhouense]